MILELLLAQRIYHKTTIETINTVTEGHAEVCGLVTYVKHQTDGDWHITLDNGKGKLVLEIIPKLPLSVPKKNDKVRAQGIVRFDKHHKWYEIHPVEFIEVVKECK